MIETREILTGTIPLTGTSSVPHAMPSLLVTPPQINESVRIERPRILEEQKVSVTPIEAKVFQPAPPHFVRSSFPSCPPNNVQQLNQVALAQSNRGFKALTPKNVVNREFNF
jgi:hypothetical protein